MSSAADTKIVQGIGLTESEADLYLAGLQLGPATAIQLAQRIRFSRQMVYTLLDNLMRTGLMKETHGDGRRLFQAMSPEILNDRARQIAENIASLVPILKTKEAANESLPAISVYENPLCMREWYREFMRAAEPKEELLIWATNTAWQAVDPKFLAEFVEFKKRIGTADRIIAPDTPVSRRFVRNNPQPNATFRFSKDWWKTNAEKWIWRDTVSYLTIKENATNMIVIRSAQLAALERFNFYTVWEQLRQN